MPDEPSIKDLLASSSIAFTGTVEAAGRSTVAGVSADEQTAVVRVDQPLHVPPGLRIPPGSRVTVQPSPDLPALKPGDSATFFANGLAYGDTLAVEETGRVSAAEAAAPAEGMAAAAVPVSPVEAALAELASEEVVKHAAESDAIVRAHVVGLEHVPTEGPPREHEPQWWIATLEVDMVVRGELPGGAGPGGTVPVLYANSLDVRWRHCPKPKAGQSGLWLLHRTSGELGNLAPFELTHPIDLQPSLQIDLLREHGVATEAPEEEAPADEEEGETEGGPAGA
jgi:hypothetical protein